MASDKVSAFNLYLLDVFDSVKTPHISVDDAYNIIEEEWKGLSRDIVFYYISKEREFELKRLRNNISNIPNHSHNSIYSQRNIQSIHELHRLMYLQNMYNHNNNNNNHFSRVEFAKSA